MKKVIQESKTVEVCDACGLQHDTNKCYGCGKEVCRDCCILYYYHFPYRREYILCKKCNDDPTVPSRIIQIRQLLNQLKSIQRQYESMEQSHKNQFDELIKELYGLELKKQ